MKTKKTMCILSIYCAHGYDQMTINQININREQVNDDRNKDNL